MDVQVAMVEGLREIMPNQKQSALGRFNNECLGTWYKLAEGLKPFFAKNDALRERMRQAFIEAWTAAEPGIYYVCVNTFTGSFAGKITFVNSRDRMFFGAPYNSIGFVEKSKLESII